MSKRPLYIHVGASKTGTSALQSALWASPQALADAGVGLPFVGRPAHMRALLRPLGWAQGVGYVGPARPRVVRDLADQLKATAGDRLLVSNEDLCQLPGPRIAMVRELAEVADLDLRVVVTARDWGRQLPSMWQQYLKQRLTLDYPTFCAAVRDRAGETAEDFWQRMDLADVCRRWGEGLAPEDVHVIAVPSMAQDPGGVYRLFGAVVGFPSDVLTVPDRHVNASYGYVEAEVLRRLNEALGDRLPEYGDYAKAVRNPLARRRLLAREASGRITLPVEHLGWIQTEMRRQLADIRSQGRTLHGDVDGLVPADDAGRPLPPLDEADVARAAVETLAAFAVRVHRKED